jgi:hypothetical protein
VERETTPGVVPLIPFIPFIPFHPLLIAILK